MADKASKPILALIFTSRVALRRYDFEPAREWRATVHVVKLEGRAIESCYDVTVPKFDLHGLVFEAYAPEGKGAHELRPRYINAESDSVARLKSMARTLDNIRKGLGALVERFGYPTSLGAEVARVADVLGVDRLMFPHVADSRSDSIGDYESEYPGHAVGRIDRLVAEWLKPLAPTVLMYTVAPESYDGMGTVTVQADLGDYDDKCMRQVEIKREHLEWQVTRYRSGMHYTSEERPQGLKTSAAA